MAEEQGRAEQVVSPPTVPASHVSITITAGDVLISFGHQRAMFDAANPKMPKGTSIEWAVSFALGAPVAVQLLEALGLALEEYRKRYGAIPKDPSGKIDVKN